MIPLRDDNPSELRPVVTASLIVIVTLVFLWQLSLGNQNGQAIVYSLGLIPSVPLGFYVETLRLSRPASCSGYGSGCSS